MSRRKSVLFCAWVAACLAGPGLSLAQSNWVDFVDETSTRIRSRYPARTTADTEEKDIAVGDLNGDGRDDVVVVRKFPFSQPGPRGNVILLNKDGRLLDRTNLSSPDFLIPDDSRDVAIFDADGDGRNDILSVNTFGEQPRLFINQGNTALGTLQIPRFVEDTNFMVPWTGPEPHFCAVATGDIDNDGDLDMFFSDYANDLEDRLCINDGTGFFTDETDKRMTAAMSESAFGTGCLIHDFNGDGWNDIVKNSTLFAPSVLRLLINDGTGNFVQFQDLPFDAVYMVEMGDVNNDGRMDLYVESDGQDYILVNTQTNPNGTIVVNRINLTNSARAAGFGGNVHAGDVNNDGFTDFGVADVDVDIPGCDRRFTIVKNNKGTSFTDPNNALTLSWNRQGNYDFGWIDINNDGKLDLLLGACDGLRMFVQQ